MKRIIIILGVIALLMITSQPLFTVDGVKAVNIENYPDLIANLYFEKDNDKNEYHIYVEVQNIGNNDAYFPAGSIFARYMTIYKIFPKKVETNHKIKDDLILEPGDKYKVYAGSDYYIFLIGAKHIVTADPENIVYEGEDGETNNVYEIISFAYKSHSIYPIFSKLNKMLENSKYLK